MVGRFDETRLATAEAKALGRREDSMIGGFNEYGAYALDFGDGNNFIAARQSTNYRHNVVYVKYRARTKVKGNHGTDLIRNANRRDCECHAISNSCRLLCFGRPSAMTTGRISTKMCEQQKSAQQKCPLWSSIPLTVLGLDRNGKPSGQSQFSEELPNVQTTAGQASQENQGRGARAYSVRGQLSH